MEERIYMAASSPPQSATSKQFETLCSHRFHTFFNFDLSLYSLTGVSLNKSDFIFIIFICIHK